MSSHPHITGILLALAVALTLVCAVGLAIMRDAFQRLHFGAPVAWIAAPLIVVAVWLEDSDPQARIKIILIALVLIMANGVLSHATARAVRIRAAGQWPPAPGERLPLVGEKGRIIGHVVEGGRVEMGPQDVEPPGTA